VTPGDEEEKLLRSVAIQNATAILLARQRAEEALEHSLAVLRATLEATTDAMIVTDNDGNVTDSNEKYYALWQISPELKKGKRHRPILAEIANQFAQPEEFLARVEEIYAQKPLETFDLLQLTNGRVLERSSALLSVNGLSFGRVWSFRDITAYRQSEEALRDETRILELLNKTNVKISSNLDLQSLVQAVTDAGTQLSGAQFGAFFHNTTDAKGDSYMLYTLSGASRESFAHLGQPRATDLFGPTFRGESPIRLDDVAKDARYGKWAPFHGMPPGHLPVRSYLAVSVVSRSGEVIGGLFFGHAEPGVFTEKIERLISGLAAQAAVAIDNARLFEAVQRAKTMAERASSTKDDFLATLSHELRTPMNAILGWSQVLQRTEVNAEGLKKGLDTIERNARAQIQLIEDLLDMSRITSGMLRLDVQPVELVPVIESAIETVRPAADAKEIRIKKVLDPGTGPISGDPHRLQQVVWNLLSNAIKFTPRGGKVDVVLERVNSHLEISIADSGIGIQSKFLPHIFERFRQADTSTTRTYGGLGLGLSIVKSIIELHGGTVAASSAGDGLGTTFTLSLPLTSVLRKSDVGLRHPEGSDSAAAFDHPDLSGIKVVVVDDEEDARDLIQRLLEDCGARVITVANPLEALVVIESERPDVLVSDIGMPIIDGYELLKRVRALGPARGGRVPAIALTAFARSEDRTRALRAGFLVHVSKPVEASELAATVASIAGRTGSSVDH
jgi:signal transduction histidine kinase/ActR/RegA family two-component response regulator